MELIIKISDKMFDTFKKHGIMAFDNLDEYNKDILADIIANGTPLPKGHGDLVDRDKLSSIYRQMSYCSTAPNFIWVGELMKVEPVIKADKESE